MRLRAQPPASPLTSELYLHVFTNIAEDLDVTASSVQLTLTGFLLGLGIGQLFLGPIVGPPISGLTICGARNFGHEPLIYSLAFALRSAAPSSMMRSLVLV